MRYIAYVIAALAVFGAAYTAFTYEKPEEISDGPSELTPAASDEAWETKVDSQNGVTVEVKPIATGDAGQWKFALTFTTHSGSLDEDLMRSAELAVDDGAAQKPVEWQGPPPGGHHIEGVLVFAAIEPQPRTVELRIQDVGGVPMRTFRWELK